MRFRVSKWQVNPTHPAKISPFTDILFFDNLKSIIIHSHVTFSNAKAKTFYSHTSGQKASKNLRNPRNQIRLFRKGRLPDRLPQTQASANQTREKGSCQERTRRKNRSSSSCTSEYSKYVTRFRFMELMKHSSYEMGERRTSKSMSRR